MDRVHRTLVLAALGIAALGGGGCADSDGDGLTDFEEIQSGTNPGAPDTDGDQVWDGEEIRMFGTNPLAVDSDGDGMTDRADPAPALAGPIPASRQAVFTDNATGTARAMISDTRYVENHVIYAPQTAGAPFLLYMAFLEDINGDGEYEEIHDLRGAAIARMNVDGSRPILLTDLDAGGRFAPDGFIDGTPEVSPDGSTILFASDRGDPLLSLRLWVMRLDGTAKQPVGFPPGSEPIPGLELDADPHWGPGNRITWKRQGFTGLNFSQALTGDLDPVTFMVSNVQVRTDGTPGVLQTLPPGDYDPKISPNGLFLTSYRHLSDGFVYENLGLPLPLGDWDVWVGLVTDPAQPGDASIQRLAVNDRVGDFFPRWNQGSNKIAFWSIDYDRFDAGQEAEDIVVMDLDIQTDPALTVAVTSRTNITLGAPGGWREEMPSWNTDPADPDGLVYSATIDPFD